MNLLQQFLDWSEAWIPLIPLLIFILKKPKEKYLSIIAFYLIVAVCLNTFGDFLWKFKNSLPSTFPGNHFVYNIHSIVRLIFFIIFFKRIDFDKHKKVYNLILLLSFINIVLIFSFTNFFVFSSLIFTLEAAVLLGLSISYFIRMLRSDEIFISFDATLLIVSGLSIYKSVNFFIFLYFDYLTVSDKVFATALWKVHNIFYFVFCLFIARAFYGTKKQEV